MDKKDFKAGSFCGSLRKHLFKEFLGLLHGGRTDPLTGKVLLDPSHVIDPICDQTFHVSYFMASFDAYCKALKGIGTLKYIKI